MRKRWAAALVTAAVLALGGAATAASATDPVRLGAEHVTDVVDVLSASQESAANTELAQLRTDTGADLYVVFVDTFTSPANSEEWANATATGNGLGVSQYLLAVSTEGRQYYLSADSEGPLSFAQVDAIEAAIQPQMTSGDYAGAIATAAERIRADLGGGGDGGGGGVATGILFVIVIGVAGVLIWMWLRSRKKSGATGRADAPAALPLPELERQAASALVQIDDAIRTSEQELGFAKAEFGDEAAAQFAQALALARQNLDKAFTLKQQLDDEQPDTDEHKRAWNEQILALCDEANRDLDQKAAAFDELRKLEQNAPAALERITAERETVAAKVESAAAALAALRETYAPEALATVADNPEQATGRIEFADEQLRAAQESLAAGDSGQAAVALRAAEEAIAQGRLLEDAITTLGTDLAAGERSAHELIGDLQADIVTARTLPDPHGAVAAAVQVAQQQIDAARQNLSGSAKRPLVTLKALEAANTQIDAAVSGARDAQQRAERARKMLGQVLMQAQAQVSAAEDYITARRGAIGATARTRLAEAGSLLVQAQQLAQSDPDRALQLGQRANELAAQAIQAAQNDVGAFSGGGMMSGGRPESSGGGMMSAVLGGIVINSLLSGGGGRRRSSGGLGGLGGGSRSRSGGGSRSRSGGFSSGSFGGGGTRSRRGGRRF